MDSPGDLTVCFAGLASEFGQHLGGLRTQVLLQRAVAPIATIKRYLDFIVGIYRISAELVDSPGDLTVCFAGLASEFGQYLG